MAAEVCNDSAKMRSPLDAPPFFCAKSEVPFSAVGRASGLTSPSSTRQLSVRNVPGCLLFGLSEGLCEAPKCIPLASARFAAGVP